MNRQGFVEHSSQARGDGECGNERSHRFPHEDEFGGSSRVLGSSAERPGSANESQKEAPQTAIVIVL